MSGDSKELVEALRSSLSIAAPMRGRGRSNTELLVEATAERAALAALVAELLESGPLRVDDSLGVGCVACPRCFGIWTRGKPERHLDDKCERLRALTLLGDAGDERARKALEGRTP